MAEIPAGVIIMWPGSLASKPAGWDVVSTLYSKFPKGTASSTSPGATTGGAATHTHTADTHTHAGPNHNHAYILPNTTWSPGGPICNSAPQEYILNKYHTHPSTSPSVTAATSGAIASSWDTISPNVLHYDMIKLESDGTPEGFPDDSVVFYNSSSAPTDWTQHAASVGDFPSTPANGGNGGGGGGSTGGGGHTHAPGASHTHPAGGTHDHGLGESGNQSEAGVTQRYQGTQCYWRVKTTHTHTVTGWDADAAGSASAASSPSSGSVSSPHSGGNYEPPYRKYLGIQNTSGEDNWLESAICMWLGDLGDIPDDWTLITDMNDRFPKFAASGGGDNNATGGSAAHTHAAASTHNHPAAAHNHGFCGAGWLSNQPPTDYDHNKHSQLLSSYTRWLSNHDHPGGTSCNSTTAYGNGIQDLNNNTCTQPTFKTVAFISAPEEPAGGGFGFHGANF
jgi:hypothetical protein